MYGFETDEGWRVRRHGLKWAVVALLLSASAAVLSSFWGHWDQLALFLERGGGANPLWFVVVFAVGASLFVPVSLLSLTSGILFGPLFGTLYTLVGATSSAVLSFLLAGWLRKEWTGDHAGARLAWIRDAVSGGGWRSVAMLRLVPLMPFAPLNYALGLCDLKLHHYIVATFVFMAPVRFAYAYVGSVGWTSISEGKGLGGGLIATVVVCILVILVPPLVKRYSQARR